MRKNFVAASHERGGAVASPEKPFHLKRACAINERIKNPLAGAVEQKLACGCFSLTKIFVDRAPTQA
jgi:hypothetical protein